MGKVSNGGKKEKESPQVRGKERGGKIQFLKILG